ncbi:MAG: BamA/TamA family outer membrane protein [Bacteroidales bacterium]
MKKIITLLLFCGIAIIKINAQAADSSKIKEGYSLSVLPVISYDSDFGFQYGLITQINNFGKPSRYPNLESLLYLEASWFTNGSALYIADYKNFALDRFEIHAGFRYQPEDRMNFIGLNGYDADRKNVDNKDSVKAFYSYKNDKILGYATGLYSLNDEKTLKILAGLEFTNVEIARPKLKNNDYESITNLYEKYQDWGLIDKNEAYGGHFTTLKLGFNYDTRTQLENPQSGIFSGVMFLVSPGFAGSGNTFYSLSLVHRQYIKLIDRKLTFAYRVGLDYKSENTPVYAKNFIYDNQLSSPVFAFGGKSTSRGVLRNRAIADAYAFSNFELRWVPIKTQILKQNINFGLNAFYDMFIIAKETDMNLSDVSAADRAKYFDYQLPKLNSSVGLGIKAIHNENFVVGVDYAHLLNGDLGDTGVYVIIGYLF